MAEERDRLSELFEKAVELSPNARHWFVQNCNGGPTVRAELQSLLAAHDRAPNLLERLAGEVLPAALQGVAEEGRINGSMLDRPAHIGSYKILDTLGEGGMGVVYLAEQERPFHRRVALKVIKLGMDTREVIGRFEAERQALALMDHPNIAQIYEAGVTEDGRPFFVMQHVPGIPITEYCDTHRFTTSERLQLFMSVCSAVQHAHQRGIIHRDIKPSNVLVMLQDERPLPKVIDFGVAKSIHQRLTEKTIFTHFGQFIGTPEYMSPEQAETKGLEVDAATDIYSLGLLLYELLVGELPFDASALRRAGHAEILRIIREQEPQQPSTRLMGLGDRATDAACRRHTNVSTLARELKGDLDWIILKALDKDRTRRYTSPLHFAADINRHLNHEPILARRRSFVYRAVVRALRPRRNAWQGIAALIVLVSSSVAGGRFLQGWVNNADTLLILAKPVGGTITGPGVLCGARGSICSVIRRRGETLELEAIPDENFVFKTFTGDCPPSGGAVLEKARSCGAVFASVPIAEPYGRVAIIRGFR